MTEQFWSLETWWGTHVHGHDTCPTRGLCKLHLNGSSSWDSQQGQASRCFSCWRSQLLMLCSTYHCEWKWPHVLCGTWNKPKDLQMPKEPILCVLQKTRTLHTYLLNNRILQRSKKGPLRLRTIWMIQKPAKHEKSEGNSNWHHNTTVWQRQTSGVCRQSKFKATCPINQC